MDVISNVNLILNLGIYILSIQINITLEWMPNDLNDSKSVMVQVMASHRQATSY